jgi:hypothetical protein
MKKTAERSRRILVHLADGALFLVRRRGLGDYFFKAPEISAAVALVLGGEAAVPGGECAPEASSGLDATGVTCDTNGPGSVHGGVATGGGRALPAALR